MNHRIHIAFERTSLRNLALDLHLRRCIRGVLELQGIPAPCEVNVLVTDDCGIRAINEAQRRIDAATDVLSFPMFSFTPGELPEDLSQYLDAETGLLPLGDMAISLEHARAQAEEYGHSLRREIGYLTIHSILHLLGYDHLDEGRMKLQMRAKEEEILRKLDLPRN